MSLKEVYDSIDNGVKGIIFFLISVIVLNEIAGGKALHSFLILVVVGILIFNQKKITKIGG